MIIVVINVVVIIIVEVIIVEVIIDDFIIVVIIIFVIIMVYIDFKLAILAIKFTNVITISYMVFHMVFNVHFNKDEEVFKSSFIILDLFTIFSLLKAQIC